MQEPGSREQRVDIGYFEGVNTLVGFNIGKKTEFTHAENARSKIIGTIEKREGQTALGVTSSNKPFITTANYGLFPFNNNPKSGLYRISVAENSTLSINVEDVMTIFDTRTMTGPGTVSYQTAPLTIIVKDSLNITDRFGENTGDTATIYQLNTSNSDQWTPLSGSGASIAGGQFSYAYTEGNVFLVNYNGLNRYIGSDGVTVTPSSTAAGHLFNTPPAFNINYYKGRLYLADYMSSFVRYPTTILRSSLPMGIIALVTADVTASTTLSVTDTRFFYTDVGANYYEIYRGPNRVTTSFGASTTRFDITNTAGSTYRYTYDGTGTDPLVTTNIAVGTVVVLAAQNFTAANNGTFTVTAVSTNYFEVTNASGVAEVDKTIGTGSIVINNIVVTAIQELTVTVIPTVTLKASDEVWIAGTYSGSKIFRWVHNPTISGRDVKQYDTFRLGGADDTPITMMTNIGNIMMISNKNSMASWNDYTLENFDLDLGCVSRKGYVRMLGNLYFIHYTGIYATGGGIPQIISNKVERYITGATRGGKEASAAGKKGRSIFFTLGDVSLYRPDGSLEKVVTDVCLEYNLTQQNWFVHKNVKAGEFATFVEETDSDRLEFTDTAGNKKVKEFLSGDTDDGKEIDFRIDTMKLTLQKDFEHLNNPIALLADVDRGASLQTFIRPDNDEEYYPVEGAMVKGLSVIKITDRDNRRGMPPILRMVSISIRDSSKQRCKISRMSLVFLGTTEDQGENDQ